MRRYALANYVDSNMKSARRHSTVTAMVDACTANGATADAPIALRELMKRPTSSDYQRQLQLTGQCEAKLSDREEYSAFPF